MATIRSDSRRTQAIIIAAAERLFSEQGLDGVSLSEINRAAGQRNKSALHYHFGSREGLLKAILQKHRDQLDVERAALLERFGADHQLSLHDAVAVMVRPLAARLDDDESGGVHYLRIMAQLSSSPGHPLNDWLFNVLPPSFARIAPTLYSSIPRMPTVLRMRRTQLMNGTMFHSMVLQSYSRPDHFASDEEFRAHRELYVEDLIDCICGLLTAPVSTTSAGRIDAWSHLPSIAPARDDTIPTFRDARPGA